MRPIDDSACPAPAVVLRPLAPRDRDVLFKIHGDADTMRYGSGDPWTTIDQADRYLELASEGAAQGTMARFALERVVDGVVVGVCSLFAISRDHRRAELGYALDRDHTGRGYMTAGLRQILDHGFDRLGLNRVEADVDPANAPSLRILERLGFRKEGVLRQRWILGGVVSDSVMYGLLRAEWEDRATA